MSALENRDSKGTFTFTRGSHRRFDIVLRYVNNQEESCLVYTVKRPVTVKIYHHGASIVYRPRNLQTASLFPSPQVSVYTSDPVIRSFVSLWIDTAVFSNPPCNPPLLQYSCNLRPQRIDIFIFLLWGMEKMRRININGDIDFWFLFFLFNFPFVIFIQFLV